MLRPRQDLVHSSQEGFESNASVLLTEEIHAGFRRCNLQSAAVGQAPGVMQIAVGICNCVCSLEKTNLCHAHTKVDVSNMVRQNDKRPHVDVFVPGVQK